MTDERKTKEQLINELVEMRGRVTDLEKLDDGRRQTQEALWRSEEQAEQLAKENAIMAEIGRIISSSLNIDEVYGRFAEEVRKLISFDRININIINRKENTLTILYVAGWNVAGRRAGDVIPFKGTGAEWVSQNRSSLLILEENREEVISRLPGLLPLFKAGLRSVMLTPLISKDQVIGVLDLQTAKQNAYTEVDLKLAGRVSNQIAGAIATAQLFAERKKAEEEREKLIRELQDALAKIKALRGLLPICASCKKIRDDKGYWNQIETYIRNHSEAEFSHSICPECTKKLYPDFADEEDPY